MSTVSAAARIDLRGAGNGFEPDGTVFPSDERWSLGATRLPAKHPVKTGASPVPGPIDTPYKNVLSLREISNALPCGDPFIISRAPPALA